MSFFLFAALLALAEAVRTPERAPWWVLGASVAFGAAVTTKTFATGSLAALAVGGVCVLLAAPTVTSGGRTPHGPSASWPRRRTPGSTTPTLRGRTPRYRCSPVRTER